MVAARIGIDTYYGYIRYVLGGRADGERGREKKEIIIINSIKIIIIIIIRIFSLIVLYYI